MEQLKPVANGELELGKTYRANVVLHMAAVLRNQSARQYTWAQWETFKVYDVEITPTGTWYKIGKPAPKAQKGAGWVSKHLLRNVLVREVCA
jgi:hypothetical protein